MIEWNCIQLLFHHLNLFSDLHFFKLLSYKKGIILDRSRDNSRKRKIFLCIIFSVKNFNKNDLEWVFEKC